MRFKVKLRTVHESPAHQEAWLDVMDEEEANRIRYGLSTALGAPYEEQEAAAQEEFDATEVFDYAPEATEIIETLPAPWQDIAQRRIERLRAPTDAAITYAAQDTLDDYVWATLQGAGIPELPVEFALEAPEPYFEPTPPPDRYSPYAPGAGEEAGVRQMERVEEFVTEQLLQAPEPPPSTWWGLP